jgi:hypothetical protein
MIRSASMTPTFWRFCVSLRLSITGFASSPRAYRSLILQITSAAQPCVVTWNTYPAMPSEPSKDQKTLSPLDWDKEPIY